MAPLANDDLSFLQAIEDLTVQQFVAKLAIEAFAIAVFPGTPRFDVKGLGTDACQPAAHDLGGHLRAIVGTNVFWNTARDHDVGHRLQDTQAVDPSSHADRQTLARE